MSETSQPTQQNIVPYLTYADAEAALRFLERAFGFTERFRLPMPDGRIGHAEVTLGGNVLMLASAYPELGLTGPGALPAVHGQVMCYVEDVDAHYQRARDAGAVCINEPRDADHGDRSYRAMDPEGHRWIFSTRLAASPDEKD